MRIKQYRSLNWVVITTVLCVMNSLSAFAHTHLEKADPAKNSTLHEAPTQVTLHFSEELETAMCKLEVKNTKTGEIVSEGKPSEGGGDQSTLQVSLKPLKHEKAKYQVNWKAVSKDTHKMQGTYEFSFDPKTE